MYKTIFAILGLCMTIGWSTAALAGEMTAEEAWAALPRYQYGQDMAPLLTIDRAVIEAMATPDSRAACAARLAKVLESSDATLAARQYVCMQLRQAGTPAQVPLLARLLANPETCESARAALEAIPGAESLGALRAGLGSLRGRALVGVINSLSNRNDVESVGKLRELANSPDAEVASAAVRALGVLADSQGSTATAALAQDDRRVWTQGQAIALLRSADTATADQARKIYEAISKDGPSPGVRRAALEGLLRLEGDSAQATVLAWLTSDSADRRQVAAGHLAALSEKQLDDLAAKFPGLSPAESVAVFEVLVRRRGKEMLPMALAAAQSDKPELRLAGVRCLGLVGDASTMSLLVDSLSGKGPLSDAAREALVRLPRKEVGEALIDALKRRPELREGAIEVLKRLRCYEAIDPLVELAATDDATVYGPALDGLRGIADPDDIDVPRLVRLWQQTPPGARRDDVERTIAVVCDRIPPTADRAKPVRAAMAKLGMPSSAECLPLLGRMGGKETLKQIDAALAGGDLQAKRLAIRGLCNWPTAEMADRVWEIAGTTDDAEIRSWAVRGYVRLNTLKSDRPEAETLAALQKAMQRAEASQDRQYVLARAGTVRTIEAVNWIAPYLDDPALAQAACRAIVEQAHHRFLRHPNMDRFGPLLEKVSRISAEPEVVERAKKYRLGL